jgi:hypothetical protein
VRQVFHASRPTPPEPAHDAATGAGSDHWEDIPRRRIARVAQKIEDPDAPIATEKVAALTVADRAAGDRIQSAPRFVHQEGIAEVPVNAPTRSVSGRGAEHERGVLPLPEGARLSVWRTSSTRPDSDTVPRSPVWGHASGAGATNHWVDLQNCKTILVEGSNGREPPPWSWIQAGKRDDHPRRSAIHPTSSRRTYARIRPGTDVAFQNAMINHIIANKLQDDYVVTHTNPFMTKPSSQGWVFSGTTRSNHIRPTGDTSSTRRASRVLRRASITRTAFRA